MKNKISLASLLTAIAFHALATERFTNVAGSMLPTKPEEIFAKRVVGLPGDKIKIVGGQLSLNGKLATRRELKGSEVLAGIKDEFLPQGKSNCSVHEEKIDKNKYQIVLCKKSEQDFEIVVPEDKVNVVK